MYIKWRCIRRQITAVVKAGTILSSHISGEVTRTKKHNATKIKLKSTKLPLVKHNVARQNNSRYYIFGHLHTTNRVVCVEPSSKLVQLSTINFCATCNSCNYWISNQWFLENVKKLNVIKFILMLIVHPYTWTTCSYFSTCIIKVPVPIDKTS